MSSTVARYEIGRQAWEQRRPVWAAALSAAVRMPGASREDARVAVESELRRLILEGSVYLFRVARFWGSEQRIEGDEIEEVLRDDRNWRPRMSSVARLPRLGLTEEGRVRFLAGDFGAASPIAWTPDWFDTTPPEMADDLNSGQLAYVATGTLIGCLVYGALAATGWTPDAAAILNRVFPYGIGLLVFAFGGMAAAGVLWYSTNSSRVAEWVFDPHVPVRAVDDLGDQRF